MNSERWKLGDAPGKEQASPVGEKYWQRLLLNRKSK
jgi:hypothetical protein